MHAPVFSLSSSLRWPVGPAQWSCLAQFAVPTPRPSHAQATTAADAAVVVHFYQGLRPQPPLTDAVPSPPTWCQGHEAVAAFPRGHADIVAWEARQRTAASVTEQRAPSAKSATTEQPNQHGPCGQLEPPAAGPGTGRAARRHAPASARPAVRSHRARATESLLRTCSRSRRSRAGAVFGDVGVAYSRNTTTDRTTHRRDVQRGWALDLPLPLFDSGGAARTEAIAQVEQSAAQLQDTAARASSEFGGQSSNDSARLHGEGRARHGRHGRAGDASDRQHLPRDDGHRTVWGVETGDRFTTHKVRANQPVGDYKEPGNAIQPQGTQVHEWKGAPASTPRPARADTPGMAPGATTARKPVGGGQQH